MGRGLLCWNERVGARTGAETGVCVSGRGAVGAFSRGVLPEDSYFSGKWEVRSSVESAGVGRGPEKNVGNRLCGESGERQPEEWGGSTRQF